MPSPNILVILNDDMGYSDLGCYGSEIDTPNLDRLAANGLQFTQFYNTPRCSPSRASLLTGLHPHQCDIGILTGQAFEGDYVGNLNNRCVTMAEVLKGAGYGCYMTGKWHLTTGSAHYEPNGTWPVERGFDHHFGTIVGGGNYFWPRTATRDFESIEERLKDDPDFYYTDAISDEAAKFIEQHVEEQPDTPFFQYVAYTAPHWPLHAKEEDIAKYKGRYDSGWDAIRERRLKRMIEKGLINPKWKLSPRDPAVPGWEYEHENLKEWQCRRMEVYAAQIDCMDQGIGRIIDTIERLGQLDNTLVIFVADNGGCSEDFGPVMDLSNTPFARAVAKDGKEIAAGNNPKVMPGSQHTFQSYGVPWANVSNTPFRMYKHWCHEGGISTPFIVHWPAGIAARGELRRQHGYFPDIMATVLDITGAVYPSEFAGCEIQTCEGASLLPAFRNEALPRRMMFWEHEGNAAVRDGKWKLVLNFAASPTGKWFESDARGDWELYDTDEDRTELRNVASQHPERVQRMKQAWEEWALRCGVIPREEWLAARHRARSA